MKYLTIEKINGGYKIKDSITDCGVKYYGYTEKQAEKKHRENFNIIGKHFIRIEI